MHRVNRNSRIPDRARRLIVTLGAMSACSRAILCLVFVPHRECVCVCSCLYVCRGTARRSEAVESKHSIRERPANDSAADRGNMSLGVYSSWPLPRVLVETWVLSWFRRCTRREDCLSFAAPTLTPASRPVGARRADCFAYTEVFRQSSRASTNKDGLTDMWNPKMGLCWRTCYGQTLPMTRLWETRSLRCALPPRRPATRCLRRPRGGTRRSNPGRKRVPLRRFG